MAHSELSHTDLVDKLFKNKEDEDLLDEASKRIQDLDQSKEFFNAVKDVHQPTEAFASRVASTGKPFWENCINEQKCYPKEKRFVSNLQDLLKAVKDGAAGRLTVRAVGSGHSFSNVCPTAGILLDPHKMKNVLTVDATSLRDSSKADSLLSVESGITISDLNTYLQKKGKALATMGAYDGQTLAGAISTGTHGSGITLGPIASLVESIVLVSETGQIYQIEPADGITDPSKFKPGPNNYVLKQDDDWFRSALVAMGCLGLIYSYTLSIVPAFLLSETRSLTTWQDFKPQIAKGLQSEPFSHHYFEIDLNPYLTKGKNTAITIIRDIPPQGTKKGGSRGFVNWLGGVLASCNIAEYLLTSTLNFFPTISPGIITNALKTLADANYVDQSYIVLNIGKVDDARALAMELSFDADQDITDIIDRVLQAFQQVAKDKNYYLAGPFACRFVAASPAYLAPQQGRPSMMVEMDMLDGVKTGRDLLRYMKKTLTEGPGGLTVRVHWGLDLDTVTKDEVPRMFSEWPKWLNVYKQLNTSGMWNSVLTDRLGITV